MRDILKEISEYKYKEIEEAKKKINPDDMEKAAKAANSPKAFLQNLRQYAPHAIIAEIKHKSPSKGILRKAFNPAKIAKSYKAAGAACLSILTDNPSFGGEPHHLIDAKKASGLPVLCKDFILDPYQIVQARSWGADCILLILAMMDEAQAKDLFSYSREWGMDILVEVHNEEELERALILQPDLLGINNRNLHNFETTLTTTLSLAKQIAEREDIFLISESGISTKEDIALLQKSGVRGFLIGEHFMRTEDPGKALEALLR